MPGPQPVGKGRRDCQDPHPRAQQRQRLPQGEAHQVGAAGGRLGEKIVVPKPPMAWKRPVEPSTREAISRPSTCPSSSTRSAPARSSTSTETGLEAVTAIGTLAAACRTVKATLVFAVSESVETTRRAREAPALR